VREVWAVNTKGKKRGKGKPRKWWGDEKGIRENQRKTEELSKKLTGQGHRGLRLGGGVREWLLFTVGSRRDQKAKKKTKTGQSQRTKKKKRKITNGKKKVGKKRLRSTKSLNKSGKKRTRKTNKKEGKVY